ncbi:hypothetical protein [Streptomyces sp. H27-S2]|uniref:hypothetical protein n=1 Tax=Streptomyces antarcticus TaxID=2996458 RepID=UPI0022719CBA|nr:hypothetical protein [Streptomyces sp. H27-S2]MCY0954728.1 hypothetical protein [Streptomyces sp. H27-S2]
MFAALVALDTAPFETDAVGELVLGQAQISAALGDAFAQLLPADDDPFWEEGRTAGLALVNARTGMILRQYPNGRFWRADALTTRMVARASLRCDLVR